MPLPIQPLLANYSGTPRPTPDIPVLEFNKTTGMLHRPGISEPFIEELLAIQPINQINLDLMSTMVTKSDDSIDRDLIRTDFHSENIEEIFGTFLTNTRTDDSDPDLLRNRYLCVASTLLTESADEGDPDLIRNDLTLIYNC